MGHVELLEKTPDGKFRVVASIREWYQIENETPVIILKIAKILQDRFNFTSKKPISGMDETVVVCTRDDVEILLGWDSSTGFYVTGKDKWGHTHVEDLAVYLDGIFDEPIFQGYVRRVSQ